MVMIAGIHTAHGPRRENTCLPGFDKAALFSYTETCYLHHCVALIEAMKRSTQTCSLQASTYRNPWCYIISEQQCLSDGVEAGPDQCCLSSFLFITPELHMKCIHQESIYDIYVLHGKSLQKWACIFPYISCYGFFLVTDKPFVL